MFPLPLREAPVLKPGKTSGNCPALYRGTFELDEVGETFLDMTQFRFGVAWVNGHMLGRHWEVGAPRSLYLPSVWQKRGKNEIIVLDLIPKPESELSMRGTERLIEITPVSFERDIKVTADAILQETATPCSQPTQ